MQQFLKPYQLFLIRNIDYKTGECWRVVWAARRNWPL